MKNNTSIVVDLCKNRHLQPTDDYIYNLIEDHTDIKGLQDHARKWINNNVAQVVGGALA